MVQQFGSRNIKCGMAFAYAIVCNCTRQVGLTAANGTRYNQPSPGLLCKFERLIQRQLKQLLRDGIVAAACWNKTFKCQFGKTPKIADGLEPLHSFAIYLIPGATAGYQAAIIRLAVRQQRVNEFSTTAHGADRFIAGITGICDIIA